MIASLESFHRTAKFWLAATIAVFSLLVIGVIVVAPSPAVAATTQRSNAMPSCMRRVTVTSNPCGATIFIDDIEVGRTPMSFPMPMGRYTLILAAPGHQQYTQRILVPDGPLEIDTKLIPLK